ncbi:hypothetical protein [Thermomonospora umbrina]|uniref:Sugar lactone lactonase YvrE n=1 Tax=Thermomonospora umbrina TaxID=111806 RepID=A0A3D9SM45_9ACTN|nr:hypothetical protein [Thermomonospora umbrina]REE96992.1 sugar lactone lactonase YvrE [Thermomonospora umbrina]
MSSLLSRRSAAGALAVLTLVALPLPSAAASHDVPGDLITGHAPSLHPEDIAYDPTRRAFIVGSLRHGTVSVVRPDGSVRTLVNDPALVSSVGIHVDARRGRLLVANSDIGVSTKSSPQTQERLAGLGVYDLRTGRRLHYVDLGAVAGDGARHLANDIAVAPDGTAYVTDSFAPVVYRVPLRGRAGVFVRDPRLAPEGFGANGIVWQAGGLVFSRYDNGTLWRVSARNPSTLRRVAMELTLPGADGLTVRPDGALLVVTNALDGKGVDAVFTLRPSKGWRRATVVLRQDSPEPAPTTAAIGSDGRPYVLSGRIDLLLGGRPGDLFTIRRF